MTLSRTSSSFEIAVIIYPMEHSFNKPKTFFVCSRSVATRIKQTCLSTYRVFGLFFAGISGYKAAFLQPGGI